MHFHVNGEFLSSSDFQNLVLPCHSLHARLILEYEVEKCEKYLHVCSGIDSFGHGGCMIVSMIKN